MAAYPSCSECSGTRWVRYFSETTDGNLEEAFRLCPCNQKSGVRGECACEEAQNRTIRVVCSLELKVLKSLHQGQNNNGSSPTS